MADRVRVGLVGADAGGGSWGSVAHIPALAAADRVELVAVCTSRPESAAAAGRAFGVPAYHDAAEMASQPDIDVVSVVVKVPKHRELVQAALEEGTHVFCEWPLGANLAETEELAALARTTGVVTAVGLQGRHDPSLAYVRQLYREGWLGDVVAIQVTMTAGGGSTRRSREAWMGKDVNGANLLTIVVGHTVDQLTYCFGPFVELSARVATLTPEWHLADTGETITVDAPDDVMVTGTLDSGAALSFRAASVPFNATGWRMEVFGTEGTIVATADGLPQIAPITLVGSQGFDQPGHLNVPTTLRGPDGIPKGPAGNVSRAYEDMAEAIQEGRSFRPDFELALEAHTLLEKMRESSEQGRTIAAP